MPTPFDYPLDAHQRHHGPAGYRDYQSFKPWLRDEFTFCCVFCLLRERWCPLGADSFGVEHLEPRSRAPALEFAYDYLLYACTRCNATKAAQTKILDPCAEGYGRHLRVTATGTFEGLTKAGRRLIAALDLNREQLQRLRRFILRIVTAAAANPDGEIAALLRDLLSFPDDLPALAALRPPGGNTRPDGVHTCYFAQRERGELPAAY